jgi:hypothetical protein
MSFHTNSKALAKTAQLPENLEAYERYTADVTEFFGDLLLHNGKTGGYTAGRDKDKVALGTELVFILTETMVGYNRFTDGSPEHALVPLASNPDLKALRATLGDLDPDKWVEKTIGGLPKDPWLSSVLIPCIDPKTLDAYTFSSTSLGGVRAGKQLIRGCVKQVRAAPETTRNHLPLVALSESSYAHPSKQVGTIFNPVLEVADWVPVSTVAEALKHHGFDIVNRDLGDEPDEVEFAEPAQPASKAAGSARRR